MPNYSSEPKLIQLPNSGFPGNFVSLCSGAFGFNVCLYVSTPLLLACYIPQNIAKNQPSENNDHSKKSLPCLIRPEIVTDMQCEKCTVVCISNYYGHMCISLGTEVNHINLETFW